METAKLARLLKNLIRADRVAEVRHTKPPTVGEQLALLAPSGDLSNGIVLCAIPLDDADVRTDHMFDASNAKKRCAPQALYGAFFFFYTVGNGHSGLIDIASRSNRRSCPTATPRISVVTIGCTEARILICTTYNR